MYMILYTAPFHPLLSAMIMHVCCEALHCVWRAPLNGNGGTERNTEIL